MVTVKKGDFMVLQRYVLNIINKRKIPFEKTKEIKDEKRDTINLKLNKYNASLLVCSLAFICRYMYYGKVEDVQLKDFYHTENFNDYFYQLRLLMHYLNESSKKYFGEDYQEYKVCRK